jgi:F0F1-type ATP synthase epsilon subunit
MSDKFTVEIITPDKSILKSEANEVTIPSYEGQMGILKDHIPLITFLRPGYISKSRRKKILCRRRNS